MIAMERGLSSIHIFGLNHFLQNPGTACMTRPGIANEQEQKDRLRLTLCEIIARNKIDLIAEEAKFEPNRLGENLAQKFAVSFTNITMPIEEREKRGIKTPDYDHADSTRKATYEVFERFMFERIKARSSASTLVMCGRRHFQALAKLFESSGDNVRTYDIYDYRWYRGRPVETAGGIIGYEREDHQ